MSGNTGQHITVKMVTVLNYRQARKCFSPICCSRKFIEIYVEINPRFCYNIGVSLCSRAGVKNPRWQADT